MTILDMDVIQAMKKFGGGFVAALGEAAQRADLDNLRRIKLAFPDYWERYTELARIELARIAVAPNLLEAAKHARTEWRLHGQLTDSCRELEAAIEKAEEEMKE